MKKLDFNTIKESIEAIDGYRLRSTEYINSATKLKIFHERCNNEYDVTYKEFKRGCRCPYCHGTHKKTVDEFNEELRNKGIRYIARTYNTALTKAEFYDPTCSKTFFMRPNDVLNGHGCPHCYGTPKHGYDKVKELIENTGEYELKSESYVNRKSKLDILCKKCGHVFQSSFAQIITNGEGCPKCARAFNSSKEEAEFYEFLKTIYPGDILRNFKIGTFEVDAYLPEKKLAFEYDGVYWHSTKFRKPTHHADKMRFFNDHGIRVINVFSNEWIENPYIVKAKVRSILGSTTDRLYARLCDVDYNVDKHEKNTFLEKHHLQGGDKASIALGLRYHGDLVAVMTFAKPRVALGIKSSNSGEYELVRFATSINIPGGFSKLLKHALEYYDINRIITYADLRYSDQNSNVYLKNGFSLDHISKPNYYYVKNGKLLHRFNFMKQRLKTLYPNIYSDDKTEFQITEEAGLYRIYDCGNAVFLYENERKRT